MFESQSALHVGISRVSFEMVNNIVGKAGEGKLASRMRGKYMTVCDIKAMYEDLYSVLQAGSYRSLFTRHTNLWLMTCLALATSTYLLRRVRTLS